MTAGAPPCPRCGAPVGPGYLFCEECGGELIPHAADRPPAPVPGAPGPGEEIGGLGGASAVLADALDAARADAVAVAAAEAAGPPRRPGVRVVEADLLTVPTLCTVCAGAIAPDGYCSSCGAPAVRPRDHYEEQPAGWVALVCDRGLRHTLNQDAGAIAAAQEPGEFAAFVICDGVSSATRSEVAALAAARAARDVLAAPDTALSARAAVPARASGTGPSFLTAPTVPIVASPAASGAPAGTDGVAGAPAGMAGAAGDAPGEASVGSTSIHSRSSVISAVVRDAGAAAQEQARAAASDPPERNPPACTFVAAVLSSATVVVGWVGDSRAYWLPDQGIAVQLSTDDSWAAEAMALGLPRAEAEQAPQAHSITRWLGLDAPDPVPRIVARRLRSPGWLLLCSDGLWNYGSEAADLADVVASLTQAHGGDPLVVARELVAWANGHGGQDNITVALARVDRAD